jgi:multicomponent Na+:H+ antiporter subunit E
MVFYAYEVMVANLRLAWDVVTPRHRLRPGIVALPLELEQEWEIILLVNLITMTPGTMSLDLSPDRKTLYVHAMYLEDADSMRRELKDKFERRIRKVCQ